MPLVVFLRILPGFSHYIDGQIFQAIRLAHLVL
jgi:hypothetical protein